MQYLFPTYPFLKLFPTCQLNISLTAPWYCNLQCDKRNPGQVCAIRDKDVMFKHFNDIAKASPIAKAQLKTMYGLPDNPSPLIKLHLDVYQ